jgi:hypothetical protein
VLQALIEFIGKPVKTNKGTTMPCCEYGRWGSTHCLKLFL